MSTQHTVPSPEFWAITPFRFSCPDDWSARQTAEQLVYFSRDDEPTTNCGIQWKRIPATVDLRRIAQVTMNVTRAAYPDVTVGLSRYGKLHGKLSYLRICEFTNHSGVKMGQVYVAFTGPLFGLDRPVELFEIAGHFDATRPERLEEIQAIVKSFQFVVAAQPVSDDERARLELTLAEGA